MINITGQMFATSDINVVNAAISQGYKIIFVGDQFEAPQGYDFIYGVALTPEYKAITAMVEGDTQKFANEYINMLSLPNVEELLLLFIVALGQGQNIMFYFPQDSLQLEYPYLLLEYIQNKFGITVGAKENPFVYNPAFHMSNVRMLYLYNLITWQDFILAVDEVDPVTIMKIKTEISGIYNIPENITDEDMTAKIQEIKDQLMKSTKDGKKRLFSYTS